jgi:hypothetical protein
MKMLSLRFETRTPFWRVALGMVLAWALALGPGMSAVQEKSEGQKAVPVKAAQKLVNPKVAESAKGPQEGIKVHGHWVIEVRNPDGKLVTKREFENALESGSVLSEILTHTYTTGPWIVSLGGPGDTLGGTSTSPCAPNACLVVEPSLDFPNAFKTLAVTLSSGSIVLSGNLTAPSAAAIGGVSTGISVCHPDISPVACTTSPSPEFMSQPLTQTTISPITVAQGQVVQVTVTISFS